MLFFKKKIVLEYDLFRNMWKGGSFSKNTRKYDIFVYMYKCYKYDITLLPKEAKIIFS